MSVCSKVIVSHSIAGMAPRRAPVAHCARPDRTVIANARPETASGQEHVRVGKLL